MVKAVRAAQLADQIRDYLAMWSGRDLVGFFVTVQQVTLSTDMASATVWVSVIPDDRAKPALNALRKHLPTYQRRLGQHLQRHMVPTLSARLIEPMADIFTLE